MQYATGGVMAVKLCFSPVPSSALARKGDASFLHETCGNGSSSRDSDSCSRRRMKRSSSVPEIMMGSPPAPSLQARRGISSSQMSLPSDLARPAAMEGSPRRVPPFSPISITRLSSPTSRPNRDRVEQLRKEECLDERQSEKEVMEITNLNHSYDELRVDTTEVMDTWSVHTSPSHQPPFISPSSPLTKAQLGARSRSLTPTSPLPSRTYCSRRSCSPVLRPSQLWASGQKRKREESYHDTDMDTSPTSYPAKRFQPSYRAVSPTISPAVSPLTGNSPLHHSSRKSSSHSESTPLTSPSGLHPGAASTNPFAVNYDSGNLDHWQSSSGNSSGSHSPLLFNAGFAVRENGSTKVLVLEDLKKYSSGYSGGELRNNLHIDPPGPPDPNSEGYVPTPLSPKGLQFRQRPFPLPSSTLPSPIPRTAIAVASPSATPLAPVRSSPVPIPKSALPHDKYLSPFNSDLSYSHGHTHSHPPPHPHPHTHRHLHPLRSHLSTSSLGSGGHRFTSKPESVVSEVKSGPSNSFSNRLGIQSPLSRISMSTSMEELHCSSVGPSTTLGGREGGSPAEQRIHVRIGRKRKESEASSSDGREENMMESDGSLTESYDEGIELTAVSKGH